MRKIFDFDSDWRYHAETPDDARQSDAYGAMYVSAKTERIKSGPGAYHHFDVENSWDYDSEIPPEKWENVTLPHDYIIKQTPDAACGSAPGFFHYHNAWYRKHFQVDASMRGQRILLLFDAISGNSTVYLNGCLIRYNHCAYTPVAVDISDYVYFDRENVVAVHIDMSLIEGWWYRGAGIYRHAKMIVTDRLCVDLYGSFVYPVLQDGAWQVPVETTVRNDGYDDASVELVHHIFDKNHIERAVFRTHGTVAARTVAPLKCTAPFADPELWDIDAPVRYTLFTEVFRDGTLCDTDQTTFGFRTVRFDPDTGFWLNGRRVKIKGVCAHQDFGLTGLAVPDNIFDYKVQLLKEMGVNGYRTAHYPHPPEMMEALDKAGILVLAEVRHFDSNEESMKQIECSIKRDRSRPSVIFWSTGNEEIRYHKLDQGIRIQRAMAAQVKKFDPYRPVTTAIGLPQDNVVMPYVDIIGINYSLHLTEGFHRAFPDKPMVSTENCAIATSVGNYTGNHPELGLLDARDRAKDAIHPGRADTWKFIAERDWMCGGFQWSAFEHRGEAAFPRLCSASGAIDLFLRKKDAFYQNVSLWTDTPMVHLLPHWNHRGLEGRNIQVWAYTNCSAVALYLNGTLIARQSVAPYGHAEWEVPYAPGVLEAVGYRGGAEVARDVVQTSGAPYALRLHAETAPIHAGTNEMALLACTVVDRDGLPVPDAQPTVRFAADHDAVIAATGSANFDQVPPHCPERKMYAGRITVGVRASRPGKTTVYACADGLAAAAIDIDVLEKPAAAQTVSCPVAGDRMEAGHM